MQIAPTYNACLRYAHLLTTNSIYQQLLTLANTCAYSTHTQLTNTNIHTIYTYHFTHSYSQFVRALCALFNVCALRLRLRVRCAMRLCCVPHVRACQPQSAIANIYVLCVFVLLMQYVKCVCVRYVYSTCAHSLLILSACVSHLFYVLFIACVYCLLALCLLSVLCVCVYFTILCVCVRSYVIY